MPSELPSSRLLTLRDLRLCDVAEGVRRLFARLGYAVESEPIPLAKSFLALAPLDDASIDRVYLLADQERKLQILLLQSNPKRDAPPLNARLHSLAESFIARGGNSLLVAAEGYPFARLTFVNPQILGTHTPAPRALIRKLVVDRRNPTRLDCAVLEACAVNGRSAEEVYRAQCDGFDVDRLADNFYREFAALLERVKEKIYAANHYARQAQDRNFVDGFSRRVLARVLLLHWLQKKGWLAGDEQFFVNQYRRVVIEEKKAYYNDFLKRLFFEILNRRRAKDASPWGEIPYLGSAMFETDRDGALDVPNILFDPQSTDSILRLFNDYHFTIEEDTRLEQEVAISANLIGRVFENLVNAEARGDTRTSPLPRSLMRLTCREALVGYLDDATRLEHDLIRAQFDGEPETLLTESQADAIESALCDARVLDPVAGAGAFLAATVREMVALRRACWRARGKEVPRSQIAEWKREFITNCLYGVDARREAIEIAKWQLWLAIIIDAERDQFEPLPSLDYNLLRGNLLIETLAGQPILAATDEPAAAQLTLELSETEKAMAALRALKDRAAKAEPQERIELQRQVQAQEAQIVLTYLRERETALEHRMKSLLRKGRQLGWKDMEQVKKQLGLLQQNLVKLGELIEEIRKGATLPLFLYRLHFAQVFEEKGGFDIVLGDSRARPEWSEEQKLALQSEYPRVYDAHADASVYFCARGLQLLREGGTLALISSGALLRARSAERLRQMLLDDTSLQVLISVDAGSDAESAVLMTRKAKPGENHLARTFSATSADLSDAFGRLKSRQPEPKARLRGLNQPKRLP
jgi:hypothetical protein